ncbi:glycerol-3-phosphate dehydrogenase [Bacillus benzoevorans]|uniref:Glycerol-3-phosphate dehydrogenase n=2 Tax=Bacillus benzoevorans TaxID=1456 RepID=A0A7X0HN94_9BACI|nr:FAD-dependent oxidoreductase [Bacillus benzoevorans]MBB6443918.1 glycerol-3-phosphate dehydrogenase [Bacillus benzoevorans]
MGRFSCLDRVNILHDMEAMEFDVLIIGGGITGCGIALDAVTRGMKTAMIEMQDFAAGTSSRSTKLVHGGLRYLKNFELKLVSEVGRERAIVYENAPHVTTPVRMLLPIYGGGTFGMLTTTIGLSLYDLLAGVHKADRKRMLAKNAVLEKEPLLKREGLKGGGYYVEYVTDDARLTIEVIKEASARGAKAVNYTKAATLLYRDGRTAGVIAVDQLTGNHYEIYAKKIINASGPWVDTIRGLDHPLKGKKIRLTKGVHIVFEQEKLPLKQAVYFDTPDGRMVFAIPRDGKTYIGTTDTFYHQDPMRPKMNKQDLQYLIKTVQYMFPSLQIKDDDVESSWAGVRPLIYEEGKDPSEISRKDEIWESETGLITIAGGKLTGYRKMAENAVNLIAHSLQNEESRSFNACQTKQLPLSGGHFGGSRQYDSFINSNRKQALEAGFTNEQFERLVHRYGSNMTRIFHYAENYDPANKYALPLEVYVEIMYALKEEMTVKPVDFFIRRTGSLLFNIEWVHKWRHPVLELMADLLKWNEKNKEVYQNELEAELLDAVQPNREG